MLDKEIDNLELRLDDAEVHKEECWENYQHAKAQVQSKRSQYVHIRVKCRDVRLAAQTFSRIEANIREARISGLQEKNVKELEGIAEIIEDAYNKVKEIGGY